MEIIMETKNNYEECVIQNMHSNICIFKDCVNNPLCNYKRGQTPIYCPSHKKEGMIFVNTKRCKNIWCYTQVNYKYNGYCLFCFINMFPDKPVSINFKKKEFEVVEFIKKQYPKYNWVYDKIIKCGCAQQVDMFLDLGEYIIIIEVYENQHIGNIPIELSQKFNHCSIVFIRFNPDDYNIGDENITSCWGINSNGNCVIKKNKINEWNNRLNSLKEQIDYWINNKTDKTIETIQLFYDC